MTNNTELDQAISLLAKIVKKSEALDKSNHLDFTLVSAVERPKYQKALATANFYIGEGVLSKEEFQQKLGIG